MRSWRNPMDVWRTWRLQKAAEKDHHSQSAKSRARLIAAVKKTNLFLPSYTAPERFAAGFETAETPGLKLEDGTQVTVAFTKISLLSAYYPGVPYFIEAKGSAIVKAATGDGGGAMVIDPGTKYPIYLAAAECLNVASSRPCEYLSRHASLSKYSAGSSIGISPAPPLSDGAKQSLHATLSQLPNVLTAHYAVMHLPDEAPNGAVGFDCGRSLTQAEELEIVQTLGPVASEQGLTNLLFVFLHGKKDLAAFLEISPFYDRAKVN